MKIISWTEAKEITESFFSPYKCVVDEKESDYQNLIPFVVYYDQSENSDRYGPHVIHKFNKRDQLEKSLSTHKKVFEETLKKH